MTLWKPSTRAGKLRWQLAVAILAAACISGGMAWYRPWETHHKGHSSSWWANRLRRYADKPRVSNLPPPLGKWVDTLWAKLDDADAPDEKELGNDPGLVPVLAELSRHPSEDLRFYAAYWLCWYRPEGSRVAVPVLAEIAQGSEHPDCRLIALTLLAELAGEKDKSDLKPAVPALITVAQDDSVEDGLRDIARHTLFVVDREAAARIGILKDVSHSW